MASCMKCGRGGIKRRKGIRKCKRCGPLPEKGKYLEKEESIHPEQRDVS